MNGVVREVSDEEILEHRAMVARWGFGCEPASAASVAGLRKLLDEQVISPERDGRLHPHRPRAEGPERDGEVSHGHRHESRCRTSRRA